MPSQSASIQSYFTPQPSPARSSHASHSPASSSSPQALARSSTVDPDGSPDNEFVPGDGFTAEELKNEPYTLPLNKPFTPPHGVPYKKIFLNALVPADHGVTFTGRVVNLYVPPANSIRNGPMAAKGCVKCVVSDGWGIITVRVWHSYPNYPLRLGSLLTVWASHVALSDNDPISRSTTPLYTSMFPERERGSHVQIHEDTPETERRFRDPLTAPDEDGQVAGLMGLAGFAEGGYDVPDGKVLVCVKSVGARKRVAERDKSTSENVTVWVFDHTAEASFTLWNEAAGTPATWKPHQTVLLLTSPGCRAYGSKISLTINSKTLVEIDPSLEDAKWLQGFARRLLKRQHCNPPFPNNVFNATDVEEAEPRTLYNLGDVDEFARVSPKEKLLGFASVIITELNIVTLHRRNMLACTECECGHPLFANASNTTCPHCEKASIPLSLNPRLLGPVVDETGSIATGKLVFSHEAWKQLLGRSPEQLLSEDIDKLRHVEQQLLFMRVSLMVGWVGGEDGFEGVGRICVVGVKG